MWTKAFLFYFFDKCRQKHFRCGPGRKRISRVYHMKPKATDIDKNKLMWQSTFTIISFQLSLTHQIHSKKNSSTSTLTSTVFSFLLSSMAAAFYRLNGNQTFHILSRSSAVRPSLPHRSMMITMSQNQSYWASVNSEIEAHLKQAIPLRPPLQVFEPMHHLVFAAPQNTAPALCLAACELVGGHRDQAMAAASALHLMHAASFTHEHLPLTDRPRPKSRPMIHHAYGPNIELLLGDAIIPFGFELLARSDDPAQNNSDRILRVTIEMTRAMGSQGMVEGQYYELECPQSDGEELCDIGWIEQVCKKKEGGLHACGAACGAILGGGSEEEIEKLRRFGLYVGMIQGAGRKEKGLKEVVEELRNLALKELEEFKGRKVEAISSFVNV